ERNWVPFDREDFETAFKELVKALDIDLDYIHTGTRLLVRAREWENRTKDASSVSSKGLLDKADHKFWRGPLTALRQAYDPTVLRGTDLEEAEHWRDKATAANKEWSPTVLQLEYIRTSRRASTARQRITLSA